MVSYVTHNAIQLLDSGTLGVYLKKVMQQCCSPSGCPSRSPVLSAQTDLLPKLSLSNTIAFVISSLDIASPLILRWISQLIGHHHHE